jgi:glutamine amidotransferase
MIAIIDYEAGNLKSVERALRYLDFPCQVTRNHEEILAAERVIFPGVGAAGKAMADLRRLGLDGVLRKTFAMGKPLLGICIGAQIILERSRENDAVCLGVMPGEVKAFPEPLLDKTNRPLKIPHMGWNAIQKLRPHPVLADIRPGEELYFVHAYYPMPAASEMILGRTEYGIEFPSIIGYKNLIATQFHLEKSGPPGLRMLHNFCKWDTKNAE